jgi:glycosyltransferase involved in cell wall biosynthesis
VHSAQQEIFGRVIVEVMAAGKPVVATCSGGPQEIVVEDETGYLVAVDAAQAMANRLMKLLASAELRASQGLAGKQRADVDFSVKRYASEIQDVVLSVTARSYKKQETES